QRTAHLVTKLRLVAVERDKLVLEELVCSIVELVGIEGPLGEACRKIVHQSFGLRVTLRKQPLEQFIDGTSESQLFRHDRILLPQLRVIRVIRGLFPTQKHVTLLELERMHCPNCALEMTNMALDDRMHMPVEIDVCAACHAFWFDKYESLKLSPASVLR